jgi:hypothetical protein
LSDAGAYAPIGTPELDLCETPRGRRRRERNRDHDQGRAAAATQSGADSQWLPAIHDPTDRVVDYNAAAFSHLRREIRRSSRAIPACKAGQDLQEVMTNPMLHTQPLAAATAREARRPQARGRYDGSHGGGGGHADEKKKTRRKGRGGKAQKAGRILGGGAGYMPSAAPDVVKSRGPPALSTFESDAHAHRPKVAARMPQSFTAMSPRHADEGADEPNAGGAADEYADEFEDVVEADDSEDPSVDELGDSMLNEMLDELVRFYAASPSCVLDDSSVRTVSCLIVAIDSGAAFAEEL